MIPNIASQLSMCGVPVFPCWDNKAPAIENGVLSASTELGQFWPSELVGVPVPDGLVIIDIDTYKGMTKEKISAFLQCQLDWDSAYVQSTPKGGGHYAFRINRPVRQNSDIEHKLIGKGFDTRATGKGYICTGGPYLSNDGLGSLRLANPGSFPELPEPAYDILEVVQPANHEPAPLPEGDRDVSEINAMLSCLDADCGRDDWMKVCRALRHHFHDDPDTGWTLFNNWSMTATTPGHYNPSICLKDWETTSPTSDNPITLGSLVHLAIENGYIPSSNAATLFSMNQPDEVSADMPDIEAIIRLINEEGGKAEMLDVLTHKIRTARCSQIQREALRATLQRVLKDHRLTITAAELRKACTPDTIAVNRVMTDQICNIDQLIVYPLQGLGNIHIQNAEMMFQFIFKHNLKRHAGEVYWWNGRNWGIVKKHEMASVVAAAFKGNDFGKHSNLTGTRMVITDIAPPIEQLSPADKRVFFNNGVFDPLHPELGLQPHDPANNNMSTLSVDFDPTMNQHPQWDHFVNDIFEVEKERITLLQEIMGWFLISHNLGIQKAVAFDGVTRGGKGTIADVLEAILGNSYAEAGLSQLIEKKKLYEMRGANLAVDREGETPNRNDMNEVRGQFKKIAANEPVSFELLYVMETWTGRLNCKFLTACNGLPQMYDDSGAAPNRWLILKFTKSFLNNQDPTLSGRLCSEAPSIANWALQGLIRLVHTGKFTMPQSSIDASNATVEMSSPLKEYADERLIINPEGRVHMRILWESYKAWCKDTNNNVLSRRRFLDSLTRTLQGEGVTYGRRVRVDDEITTGLIGVSMAPCHEGVNNVTSITKAGSTFAKNKIDKT